LEEEELPMVVVLLGLSMYGVTSRLDVFVKAELKIDEVV